ncbi:hypothetical protein ACFY4C_41930 [Actinomadura viridis]
MESNGRVSWTIMSGGYDYGGDTLERRGRAKFDEIADAYAAATELWQEI